MLQSERAAILLSSAQTEAINDRSAIISLLACCKQQCRHSKHELFLYNMEDLRCLEHIFTCYLVTLFSITEESEVVDHRSMISGPTFEFVFNFLKQY